MNPPANHDSIGKPAFIVFVVCVIAYALLYAGDRHLRLHKGPWEVDFRADTNGTPELVVNQPALGISNVVIRFPGESLPADASPGDLRFDEPTLRPGFGELRFHDLSYLPGTITLLAFNHEIELIPRALWIDRREIPWPEAKMIELAPTNQPPPPQSKRYRKSDGDAAER